MAQIQTMYLTHEQPQRFQLDVPAITDIVHSGYPHVRLRTHTALDSSGIISDNQDLFPNPPGEAKR